MNTSQQIHGVWKRYIAAKVRTRKGKALRQRDIPTTEAGTGYAERFSQEHKRADLYFTPCLFKHQKNGKRTATQATWVSWLWLDIDGVPGARTAGEAWATLADKLDELGIPQPSIVFCTSEKQEDLECLPRLQAYWRIEDLWVGKPKTRRLWRTVAGMLCDVLIAAGFSVDRGASTNVVGYMRLPGSVNIKTGTRVEQVGPKHDRVYLLSELRAILTEKLPAKTDGIGLGRGQGISDKARKRGKLTELPQVKVLARGVSHGLRNLALYGLSKALFADGFTLEQATEWSLAWNARCDPPEDRSKVKDVVARCYGTYGPQANPKDFTGISPEIVAATVSAKTGQDVKPDPKLRAWFPHRLERRPVWKPTQRRGRPRAKIRPWEIIQKRTLKALKKQRKTTLAEIALQANVSERTIKRYSGKLKDQLRCKRLHLIRTQDGFQIIREFENPLKIQEVPQIQTVIGGGARFLGVGVSETVLGGRDPPVLGLSRAFEGVVEEFLTKLRMELVERGLGESLIVERLARVWEHLVKRRGG